MASKNTKSADEKKAEKEAAKLAKAEAKAKEKAEKEAAKKKTAADKLRNAGGDYVVTLKVNGEEYVSSNDNLAQAILGLNPDKQLKTKCSITVEFNGLKTELTVLPKKLKRPLVNADAAVFLAKQLTMRLK